MSYKYDYSREERELRDKENYSVAALLLVFGAALALTMVNEYPFRFDGASYALGGLNILGTAKTLLSTLSLESARSFAISHHAHYQSLGAVMTSPPLPFVILAASFFLFGATRFASALPAMLEAVITVFLTYRLAMLLYNDRRTAFLSAALLSLNPLFFYYAHHVLVDSGLTMFTAIMLYFFVLYLREGKSADLCISAAALGLGVLLRPTMIFVLPVPALFLLPGLWREVRHGSRQFGLSAHLKGLICALAMFAMLMVPWVAEDFYFRGQGLTSPLSRWSGHPAVSKIEALASAGLAGSESGSSGAEVQAPGFLLAKDPFSSEAVKAKAELIEHKLDLPFSKNLLFNASALGYQWFLIPLFIAFAVFLYSDFSHHGLKDILKESRRGELMLLCWTLFCPLFFSLIWADERYMLYALPFFVMLSVRGLALWLKGQSFNAAAMLLIALGLFQLFSFVPAAAEARALPDFDSASSFVLEDNALDASAGSLAPFSVITTEQKLQQFSFAVTDKERKAYVLGNPQKAEDFVKMIEGSYSDEEWSAFDVKHPTVKYVIVHEGYDGRDTWDYNASSFMSDRPDFSLVKTMEGRYPGKRTFVYKKK